MQTVDKLSCKLRQIDLIIDGLTANDHNKPYSYSYIYTYVCGLVEIRQQQQKREKVFTLHSLRAHETRQQGCTTKPSQALVSSACFLLFTMLVKRFIQAVVIYVVACWCGPNLQRISNAYNKCRFHLSDRHHTLLSNVTPECGEKTVLSVEG